MNLQKYTKEMPRNSKPSHKDFNPSHFDEVVGHSNAIYGLGQLIRHGDIDMPVLLVGATTATTALSRVYARTANCAQTTNLEFGGRADCGCEPCKTKPEVGGFSYQEIDLADTKSRLQQYSEGPSGPPLDGGRRGFVLLKNVDKSLRGTDHLLTWLERRSFNVPMLTAEDARLLPDTIVSRCAVFRLRPLNQVEMEALCWRMLEIAGMSLNENDVAWIASLCDENVGQLATLVRYISDLSMPERNDLRSSLGSANWVVNFTEYLEHRLRRDDLVVDRLADFHTLNHARRFVAAVFGDPGRILMTSIVMASGNAASGRLNMLRVEIMSCTAPRDWTAVCKRIQAIAADDYASDPWKLLDEIADEICAGTLSCETLVPVRDGQ